MHVSSKEFFEIQTIGLGFGLGLVLGSGGGGGWGGGGGQFSSGAFVVEP